MTCWLDVRGGGVGAVTSCQRQLDVSKRGFNWWWTLSSQRDAAVMCCDVPHGQIGTAPQRRRSPAAPDGGRQKHGRRRNTKEAGQNDPVN